MARRPKEFYSNPVHFRRRPFTRPQSAATPRIISRASQQCGKNSITLRDGLPILKLHIEQDRSPRVVGKGLPHVEKYERVTRKVIFLRVNLGVQEPLLIYVSDSSNHDFDVAVQVSAEALGKVGRVSTRPDRARRTASSSTPPWGAAPDPACADAP